jgi:hypothetical protein
LAQLNIKNGESILFINNKKEEDKKKKTKYILTTRENEQMQKFRKEYNEKYLDKELKKLNINIDNKVDNANIDGKTEVSFRRFIAAKERFSGVEVNEHNHRLVYCLTNFNWICNICKIKYKKELGKYYCSLCDFSMCEKCHYKKNYFMKKSFPKDVKPSNASVNINFLNTDYHEHKLVFCRHSRRFYKYKDWKCRNCNEEFENEIWCFYCTICNYCLCCDCCGYH